MEKLDLHDIQGILVRGYGNLKAALYVLLAIEDPASTKVWLSSLADQITPGQEKVEVFALNIAFTSSGLRKIGLAPETLALFSNEFLSGMTTPHRQRILGDVGPNAPEYWSWGGPNTAAIDILLMFFTRDRAELAELYGAHSQAFPSRGLMEIQQLETGEIGGKEHFGFRDGISQPIIEGLSRKGTAANTLRAGEFILGYRNEYGLYTDRPLVAPAADPQGLLPDDSAGSGNRDLGRNGSYLVFRQLSQDVRGFWQFLDQATKNSDGSSNPEARLRLAAKIVGRWPNGAPLVQAPDVDVPALGDANDFGYHQNDPLGLNCPIGAHVRRTNPRDSLDPRPGTEASIAVNKRHRLLRRGREYGEPLDIESLWDGGTLATVDEERGLHFICINANIARQFEFVQHTWLNNPKFDRLYDSVDPLVGQRAVHGGSFTMPGDPVRERVTGLPEFVRVRGGGYFFLPGIRAIRYLAYPVQLSGTMRFSQPKWSDSRGLF